MRVGKHEFWPPPLAAGQQCEIDGELHSNLRLPIAYTRLSCSPPIASRCWGEWCVMPLISSKMTFFYKRIYPVIWFGILAAFLLIALLISNVPFLVVTALLAIISYQFMKKMAFDLVDEVFDVGYALLVRNGGREERIALADIKNVNFLPYISPPRVTLSLRRPSVFGDTIVFCAPTRMRPPSFIEKLVDRIDAARRGN